jgi:hypothetical protein
VFRCRGDLSAERKGGMEGGASTWQPPEDHLITACRAHAVTPQCSVHGVLSLTVAMAGGAEAVQCHHPLVTKS